MKKVIRFFLNILAIALASVAICQTEENTPLQKRLVLEEWLFGPFPAQESQLLVHQQGTENLLYIDQYGTKAMVLQSGLYNEAYSTQVSPGGKVQIRQRGTANHYHGITAGEEIELSILQHGGYNSIMQNLSGDQMMFEVIQEGNFNDIQHSGDHWSAPLRIQQRGNDMRLIIRSRN
ncbi:hypothetical protein C900_02157 [Fulvivirga imtechensis AK7]|uniref:Uncharacterized protein n=1 Tax=Fulvivirga imtechensis AK7 TaxID=1237149 RepID=L8JUK3_9BACT|nr:hypothetical protein [Fulvivirga imtechensis]ELR71918.1 hypothetical protein C900_02157 [Fulvivirga imtechensis AK7]